MRPPGPFHLVALDLLGSGPALGRAQHDHRPARANRGVRLARGFLVRADVGDGLVQRRGHGLMHHRRLTAFDEVRLVAVADEQRLQLLVADPRQNGRIRDLVAVEIQDGQHRAVAHWIEELVGMPRGRQRAGFSLAVAYDAGGDQVGVVEHHAVRMGKAVAKLSAFVDGTWSFRRDMAADVAREGKLLEELCHPFRVFGFVRVDLGVGALEIGRAEHPRRAVAGSGDENHVEVVPDDHAIEVHPDERQRRARPPVPEQTMLDMRRHQRFCEQRVVLQINHPDRKIIAGSPVGVHGLQFGRRERRADRGFGFDLFGTADFATTVLLQSVANSSLWKRYTSPRATALLHVAR